MGLRRFLRRGRIDRERALEIRAHVDHAADDLIAAGWAPEAARTEALRRLGNPTLIREEIYEMNSLPVFETLVRDLRYAVRMLRKTPGFTLAAALTLGLGIGANTAVFSVVDALLLEPLPYPRAEALAFLQRYFRSPRGESRETGSDGQMWLTVRDNATTVDAAAVGGTSGVNLVANNQTAYVHQQRVSAGYFRVVGIPPAIGREFSADEDRVSGDRVVILNNDLWRRHFGADPAIVGRSITLRGESYTVIGVLPPNFPVTSRYSFQAGQGVDVWTPLRASTTGEGGGTNYQVIARLRDGVSWRQAQQDILRLSAQAFAPRHLPADVLAELSLAPMQEAMTREIRDPLLMLWAAVGIVLAIACVNVAGLLLARGSTRTREIATRMALGSGRAAVVRQLLVESVALAALGGALGLALGWIALTALATLAADVFGLWQRIGLDVRVLAVTLAIALGTSIVFGLVPALQASRLDVQAGLAARGTRSIAGAAHGWPRRLLVIAEVALGVVLLVSAALLVRSFVHLRDLDPGFDASNLVTASVSLQDARYREPAQVQQLFDETLRRLRSEPGIEQAGVALGTPYSRLLNNGFRRIDGPQPDRENQGQLTNMSYVTAGYFETLRIPLRRGRAIADSDTAASPAVVVVNDSFARAYYRGDDPVGRHIRSGKSVYEIVGVVGDTQQADAGWAPPGASRGPIAPLPCAYVPVSQTNGDFLRIVHIWFEPSWIVRASMPVNAVAAAVRRAVEGVDSGLPISTVHTIGALRADRLAAQRFMMLLAAGLALIALILASIGIHGLIASSVSERTRELGIRLALGATSTQAMRGVVLPGILLAGTGVIVGGAAAAAAARLLRSYLWGVTANDPGTFAGVIVLLLAVAAVASVVPARRVLRLDPAQTLRAE